MLPNVCTDKPQILFVDDEEQVLRSLENYFFDNDTWDIYYVGSGAQAMAMLETKPIDVLVTDIRMPGMDGFQLLEKVCERWSKTLRMVVSGQFDEQRLLNSAGLAQQYLFKPSDPAHVEKAIGALLSTRSRLHNDRLAEAVGGMTAIPTMPGTYQKIMELAKKQDSSLRAIGAIAANDVSLTAKILQLVNSVYFGLRKHVVSAEEGAVFLGIEALKSMALASKVFSDADVAGLPKGYIDALWDHSLLVGTCSRAIAHAAGRDKVFVDNAFSSGLLHDLGRVVLILNKKKEYIDYLAAVDATYDSSLATERTFFGTDHCEIGGYVLSLWGLPNALVEPVLSSRDPREAHSGRDHATVVYMANIFCHEFRRQRCFRHAIQWDEKMGELVLQKKITAEWKALCAEIVSGRVPETKGGVR